MYHLHTNKLDIMVNPEHRLYVSERDGDFGLRYAIDVEGKRVKHKKDALWEAPDVQTFTIPGITKTYKHVFASGDRHHKDQKYKDHNKAVSPVEIPMDLWLEFLGYYLSEGSCPGKYTVNVAQSKVVNPEKYEKMLLCHKKLPYAFTEKADGLGFSISSKQLNSYMKSFGRSHDKYIDRAILNTISARQARILLDALLVGDGCITHAPGKSSVRYATVSARLAGDVQELALKAGLAADVFTYGDLKLVTIRGMFKRSGGTTTVNKFRKDDEWVDYDGKIYCVNVPGHIIYVRRNGKAGWCGNTCWSELKCLVNISRLAGSIYEQFRPPKGYLVFRTRNFESLQSQIMEAEERLKTNPCYIPKLAVESEAGERFVEWLPLTNDFNELQTIPLMKELRERIEAVFGVSNMMMADVSSSGGLNNEGLQITVTLRTIARRQHNWEAKRLPRIMEALEITDYRLRFPPPVEEDRMANLERRRINLELIERAMKMGARIEIINEEDFEFKLTSPITHPSDFMMMGDGTVAAPGDPRNPNAGGEDNGGPTGGSRAPPGSAKPIPRIGEREEKAFLYNAGWTPARKQKRTHSSQNSNLRWARLLRARITRRSSTPAASQNSMLSSIKSVQHGMAELSQRMQSSSKKGSRR